MPEEITLSSAQPLIRTQNLMERLYYGWLVSRWLSLDVAAGAMVCCLVASKWMNISPLPRLAAGVLAGTVLVIYTLDHVMDVWATAGKVCSPRRQFHWRFRKEMLLFSLLLSCMLGVIALVYLPPKVLSFGITLALLVVLYLYLVKKLGSNEGKHWFHKEILIACMYTVGIWSVGFAYSNSMMLLYVYAALAFGLLALQNLLLFSLFEKEEDFRQGQRSMVIYLGHRSIKRLLMLLFCSFSILIFEAWQRCNDIFEKQAVITLSLMAVILLMLMAFPRYFARYKRYRWLGDGVFLLPVWLLL